MRTWLTAVRALGSPRIRSDNEHLAGADGPEAAGLTDSGIRAALATVLAAPGFEATPRSRDFLAYIVAEALAGRADRIKAFTIATDVFGRKSDFDAHGDPIVRLEAGRLRRALEQYYAGPGQHDAVVISVPKGGYVPLFEPGERSRAAASAPRRRYRHLVAPLALALILLAAGAGAFLMTTPFGSAPARGPAIPRLVVRPFEDLSGSEESRVIVKGLTQEIIGQISKFRDIVTIDGDAAGASDPAARYILAGSVSAAQDKLRLQLRVLGAQDGAVLWAQSYEADLEPSQVIAVEKDIARQIATALGQPYGVIFKADSERSMPHAPDDWTAYSCALSYYAYRDTLDAKTHPLIRKCLEDSVARFPGYATGWALLSQTYIDEIRFRYPIDPSMAPASLERALAAARRAVALDPRNVRALQGEMFALYFSGQIEASLAVGAEALKVNPNDTELMGEYGSRLAVSGQWDKGCALISEARDRTPGPLGYYEAFLSVCAYMRGDFETATMWIKKSGVVDNPGYHLISAAVFAESGMAEEAARERDWLMANARDLVDSIWTWTVIRYARPEDRERFVGSLRKAGLPVPAAPPATPTLGKI